MMNHIFWNTGKKIGLFLALIILSFPIMGQRPIEVIINFTPPYPREFTAYFNNPQAYSITAINHTEQEVTVYFLGEIRGTSNGVLIRTLPSLRADIPVTIPPLGVVNLNGEEIAGLYNDATSDDLEIIGIPPQEFNVNGMLPEGEYVWCINAYEFNNNNLPLSSGCTMPFSIYYGDQLNIITPYEDEVVTNDVFTIFWDPVISDPTKRDQLEYEIKIIDLTEYPQSDLDLLFLDGSAQALLDKVVYDQSYIYNNDGSDWDMIDGHQYGLRIRAVDPFNEVQFGNNGYSEIRTFWFGFNPNDNEEEEPASNAVSDCFENCHYTSNISTNNASNPAAFSEWQIGHFVMREIDITNNNGVAYEGTASVEIPWLNNLKIAVAFQNLKINTAGRVYDGFAKAIDESGGEYDLGDIYNTLFVGKSECPSASLAALSDEISTARSLFNMAAGQAAGVPLGINQDLEGRQFTLGIIDMKFEPDRASIALINVLELSGLAENFWVSIAGNDICLTPAGIGGEYILYQAFEKRGTGFGDLDIKTFGGLGDDQTIKDNYCYIEMNCEGMKSMAIRGELAFDRSLIIPDNNGNAGSGKAKGRFSMTLDKRNDPATSLYAYNNNEAMTGTHMMFGFDMDPFQVTGLAGWTFEPAQDAYLDLSDLENPDQMQFPEGYNTQAIYGSDPALITTWRGVFIKNIEIKSPKEFTNGTRRGAFAQNIIFDPTLTMDIGVSGLLETGDGNLSGWGFSIDTFKIEIVQNDFISGGLYGGINPPITGDGDYLNYKAILTKEENNQFEFTAIALPDSLISVPISLAKAALCPNSYVQFTMGENGAQVGTFLKGQMVIDVMENLPASIEVPDAIPGLVIRLADFQFNYNSTQGFVTESMVSDGTHSCFGFGIDLADATCGDLYTGPIAEFEGFEGYEYDVSDLDELLANGLPEEPSMQENMDGFPISINDIAIGFAGGEVSIDFDLDVSLSTDMFDFMIGARVNVWNSLTTNNKGITRFKPNRIGLECGRFGGSDGDGIGFDPFVVKGEVCLTNNEDGTKGFHGDVELTLGTFTASLIAGFGKYGTPDAGEFGSRRYYGYWYFDGMFRLSVPPPISGIDVLPPFNLVHFCGLGGGIYWNATAPEFVVSMDQITNPEPTSTGADRPTPVYGNRILKFNTSWNLAADQVFMIDPYVYGEWNVNTGLRSLGFGGDFWSMALSYAQRNDARLYGRSSTTLTFTDNGNGGTKVCLLGENTINANIIPNLLYGAGLNKRLIRSGFAIGPESEFPGEDSNGDSDDIFWFFNAGNPYINDMGGIVFDLPGFNLSQNQKNGNHLGIDAGFSAMLYLMTGQNIPGELPPPPGAVATLFGMQSSEEGSFDGGDKEDERNPLQASGGHGLVMGAHVTASCEIRAIFYASLKIFTGMDIMLVNLDGQSCYTSNGVVQNPGVNGWYGSGRAYAGLEGAIGVKGKILGKEIDVKIIQLIAAMMLEAGGPDPMWLDGRAILQYNLLAGTIKGSARMMISIGDKCVPPQTSPFDFPIIAEYYPNEEENRDIDPNVRPSVSFTVPVDEWLSIPDVDGKIHEIKPVLDKFELTAECNNCSSAQRDTDYDLLAEDGRSATYKPRNLLGPTNGAQGRKEYRMKIVVKAIEKRNNGNEVLVSLNGQTWKEEKEITFRTGDLPYPIPQEYIGKTKPITHQKFYLQNEDTGGHYVQTQSNINELYYYLQDTRGREFDYFAVYRDNQGEELNRQTVNYNSGNLRLNWNKPNLDNNKEFVVQIVRKPKPTPGISSPLSLARKTLINTNLLQAYNADSLSFEYKVEPELPELSALTQVSAGEVLLHAFEFETSRFNTLTDKMATAEVTVDAQNNYHQLDFDNFEGFDKYDIFGYKMDDENLHEMHKAPPRVEIADPFISGFHTNLSKPKLGNFATVYNDEYRGEPTGCESSVTISQTGAGGIGIAQTQGAGGSSGGGISTNENQSGNNNNNNNGGSGSQGSTSVVPLLFPYLPSTNFAWSNSENLYAPLNDFAINSTVLQNDEEDDNFMVNYQAFNSSGSNVSYANEFSLKYYILEDVLQDAQEYADFGEQWLDIVENTCNPPTGSANYNQSLSSGQVSALIQNLESITNTILNSNLIQGPGQNGFSNKVKFRANKSYNYDEEDWGSSKIMQFDVH